MLDHRRKLVLHGLRITLVSVRAEIEGGGNRNIGGDFAAVVVKPLQLKREDLWCVLDCAASVFGAFGVLASGAAVPLDRLDHVTVHVLCKSAGWDAGVDGDWEGAV